MAMSADGVAAVVSGVDLALVSWVDGPVVDLSSVAGQPRPHQHQRIGRCLCAKDAAVLAETEGLAQESSSLPATLKPTLKKTRQNASASSSVSYSASTKTSSVDRHIVPQVVEVSHRTKQQQQQHGQVSRTNSAADKSVDRAVRISRPSTTIKNHDSITPTTAPTKPILSRKNWNNTIDVSGVGSAAAQQQQHQPSCLRRYGSQQSCKSATTLRSYVTSTGQRGNL